VVLGALVALSLGLITRSVIRAGRVFLAGWRVGTLVRRVARPVADGALALDGFAGVSLAGILRPKILIGTTAMECLTRAELDVAIAHEVAHRRSNDNLKRLVLHCVPDFFGWTAAARELEARWEAEVECEADASAVAGDDRRAVLLASALVKVSRQRRVPSLLPASPAWSAFHEPSILETRVRRLVNGITPMASWERLWPAATLALALSSALLFGRSHTLHLVTEAMVAYLP
jgi:hypothetical protein